MPWLETVSSAVGPLWEDRIEPFRAGLEASLGRDLEGEAVVLNRTSSVLLARLDGQPVYLKRYEYRDWRAILRGSFRTTWGAPGRVVREWQALQHLAQHQLQPDLRVWCAHRRQLGCLRESVLITQGFAGEPLDSLPPHEPCWPALLHALWSWVAAMHRSGHRDRNLDPRNLLVARRDGGFAFAKVDSPRSYRVAPGDADRRSRADDLARLGVGLLRLGLPPALLEQSWPWPLSATPRST